jgi:hypothetical protein
MLPSLSRCAGMSVCLIKPHSTPLASAAVEADLGVFSIVPYYATPPIIRTQWRRIVLTAKQSIRKDVEGSGRDLFEVLSEHKQETSLSRFEASTCGTRV